MQNSFNNLIGDLINNYQMGFITSHEFLCKYLDLLSQFQASRVLRNLMDEALRPLANDVISCVRGNWDLETIKENPELIHREQESDLV